jgi:hypothetical protein
VASGTVEMNADEPDDRLIDLFIDCFRARDQLQSGVAKEMMLCGLWYARIERERESGGQ